MPILRLNATDTGVQVHGSPVNPNHVISRGAKISRGPVIIMVHGFKYDPNQWIFCPHRMIFAQHPEWALHHRVHWPRQLGFGQGVADEGLGIAFGWRARGTLGQAQEAACDAGARLAGVIEQIKMHKPQRPVHVITHSMGSEVLFSALHALPAQSVDRIVVLTGASYCSRAQAALETPAGQTAEFFNIMTRENDVFDCAFERLICAPVKGDLALGAGIEAKNAVNVQIDCPQTLAQLQHFGGHIAASKRRICHWSGYTREGALQFYGKALRHPDQVPLQILKERLCRSPAVR